MMHIYHSSAIKDRRADRSARRYKISFHYMLVALTKGDMCVIY